MAISAEQRMVARFVHARLVAALGQDRVLPFEDETGEWWHDAECIVAALSGDPGDGDQGAG